MSQLKKFKNLINDSWNHFEKYRTRSETIRNIKYEVLYPSIPILYFGDFNSYIKSSKRIITVSLNPSYSEFPYYNIFARFKGGKKIYDKNTLNDIEKQYYLDVLNQYFDKNSCPYNWFEHLDHLLQNIGCSYYDNISDNISLHTDICTPLATNPTWSEFRKGARSLSKLIEKDGISIWHDLIKILQPEVVLMSFSIRYLKKIKYIDIDNYKKFYKFDGDKRKKPYNVLLYKGIINGKITNFIYGDGGRKPFLISNNQKSELGTKIGKLFVCV